MIAHHNIKIRLLKLKCVLYKYFKLIKKTLSRRYMLIKHFYDIY